MEYFLVKSVKIMYFMMYCFHVESCTLWVIDISFLNWFSTDYGYWLDLLTISLENSRVFCVSNKPCFILLLNIFDIIVFLC